MKHTEENGVPGLTVDIKKQRLRINRNTFRQMDNPIYFRLLVNPDAKGLVIEACTEADVGSYHVSKRCPNYPLRSRASPIEFSPHWLRNYK